jgi:hypothetical protein
MSITLSNRVKAVKPSPTLAITARAAQMRAAGKDIIGLGAGEPDFDTPDHIKAAAIKALDSGFTKYTAVDGTAGLKKAIIAKFKQDNGLEYQPKQVLVSCGGKQSSFNLTQALLNAGDEVIIPAPFWVSYPDMVLLAGGGAAQSPLLCSSNWRFAGRFCGEWADLSKWPPPRRKTSAPAANPSRVAPIPSRCCAACASRRRRSTKPSTGGCGWEPESFRIG